MIFFVVSAFLLVSQPCTSRSVNEEESVVSVYTTLPSAGHGGSLDVYQQIASNIAEKITSPIYRFFGFNATEEKTTKRPFDRVELPTDKSKTINDTQRDVEELSDEFIKKSNEKPEKFTLFSSYLPFNLNYEKKDKNDSLEIDDVFNFDNQNDSSDNRVDSNNNKADSNHNKVDSVDKDSVDDSFVEVGDASSPRGLFVYLLELFGSIIQLLYGGFLNLFRPSNSDSSDD